MAKSPYTVEQRIQAAIDYLNGTRSTIEISRELGISDDNTICKWAYAYKLYDIEAFLPKTRNNSYSKEFKIKVVEEYIDGKGSIDELAIKYKIPAKETLRRWIMKYNSDIELKDYDPKQEVYMAEARRKTSIEERIEIVNYCIDHNKDYKNTAEKYDVSYSQVYSWTKIQRKRRACFSRQTRTS